ncbi:M48 family metalloprotease [Amphritea sp. 1_MG-2023]|uniref:M48 family metalloprotease n=1 Tax=Amphritea sp. 1_MG-2023 TaxID=3062670 RepID=UPI0026E46A4E|nr:M48 family metalloprotease [Amphritea sp. 1_MG-2023]MDO6563558.1 M48 family metalloprotease [Amphritea sp. 1_MG-2023]
MKKQLAILCTGFVLSGCMGSTMSQVKGWIPGGFNDEQPFLEQLDKHHEPGLFARGPQQDQYQQQSIGLGLIYYPELEKFINQRLDQLKKTSGISGLKGKAYVVADTAFGARCSADGNIYIPFGMLGDIDTEDMLVALLAHELSHNIMNHSDSDLFVKIQQKGVMASAAIAGLNKDDSDIIPAKDKQRMENALGLMLVSDGFINPGWTRGQESQADKLGLDLMITAGFSTQGMFDLMDKMEAWEDQNKAIQDAAKLQQIEAFKQYQNESEDPLNAGFNNALASLQSNLKALLTDASKSHDNASDRIETLLEYSDQHYPTLEDPLDRTLAWSKLINSARYKTLNQSLKSTFKAHEQMSKGDINRSATTISKAVNGYNRNQNFIREVFYEVRAQQSRTSSMAANLKYGIQGQYPSFKLYVNQAKLKVKNNALPAEALDSLIKEFDRYGHPPHYYKDVIALAEAAGDNLASSSLKAECNLKYAGEGVSCAHEQAATGLSFDKMIIEKLSF